MHISPILSSLKRHRIAATLLILEIALTCAIVSNAIFLISSRVSVMERESGIAESEVSWLNIARLRDGDATSLTNEDMEAMRAIPGVKSIAIINQLPFLGSSWNSDARRQPGPEFEGVNVATFLGTEDLMETLGLSLIAGRDFNAEDYVDIDKVQAKGSKVLPASVIITRAVADRMFGDKPALGENLYIWGNSAMRVVGVVERLRRPGRHQAGREDLSVILPVKLTFARGTYALRTEPGQRAAALEGALAVINKNDSTRLIVGKGTLEEKRNDYFSQDRSMAWLLVAVCIALLLITALGIVGLASFWVQQRRRQIGVRRALGATRRDILRYFQTENFLLTTMGIFLGMLMAYGINSTLMDHYEISRLPASYLPIGALSLYALCQVAVLGPAVRATRVPPAVATRGA